MTNFRILSKVFSATPLKSKISFTFKERNKLWDVILPQESFTILLGEGGWDFATECTPLLLGSFVNRKWSTTTTYLFFCMWGPKTIQTANNRSYCWFQTLQTQKMNLL